MAEHLGKLFIRAQLGGREAGVRASVAHGATRGALPSRGEIGMIGAMVSSPDPSTQPADRRVFVGRRRELAELRAGLDNVERGRGRFFLVVGEAGIGKTRLVEELARGGDAAPRDRALGTLLGRRGRAAVLAVDAGAARVPPRQRREAPDPHRTRGALPGAARSRARGTAPG
ncbi:MAG: hypothetical protein E6J87_08540 [Deltaproteobacteria bacterium]|nr:MAG: hypothetical protein E6J87_08540 [Deltaproteobacteria bacterium]